MSHGVVEDVMMKHYGSSGNATTEQFDSTGQGEHGLVDVVG